MPITTHPEWLQIALYAAGAAVLLVLLFNLPRVGPFFRAAFSLSILAFGFFVLLQQAPYDPNLSRLAAKLGLHDQQVSGDEVRIRMSRDGHFWAQVKLNGASQRMLIDSGATITALSSQTAARAGVDRDDSVIPVMMRTANGVVRADTGVIDRLELGGVEARNLRVVISPALGPVDVLGMNFLSQLASWRVEDRTLILVPKPEEGGGAPETRPAMAAPGG
ncbi:MULTISPECIES: TIGR02281 family clan AA aspartic protease [unclassified Phenylobacterium]|uniref:retropepsin-like aspartic protease family protein n=1 Tax=unclassified Phenylobacterium TaxID=2640670 RepID=UPI00083AFE95|nr:MULTISPECIES: retropepsin-like aspartic protease [unclassified Phenylobacterium]